MIKKDFKSALKNMIKAIENHRYDEAATYLVSGFMWCDHNDLGYTVHPGGWDGLHTRLEKEPEDDSDN